MSEENLRTLIEFVGAILIAFITYFLTRSHYERKRQDDLADRDFARRVAVHDMRIKEARDYVDSWDLVIKLLNKIFRVLKNQNNIESIGTRWKGISEGYSNLSLLLDEASRKGASITILDDTELSALRRELILGFAPISSRLTENFRLIAKNESSNVSKDEVEVFLKVFSSAGEIIIKMKIRLDKLAQTVP